MENQDQINGRFKFLKTTTIIFYSIMVIGCILALGFYTYIFVVLSQANVTDQNTQKTIDEGEQAAIFLIVCLVLSCLFNGVAILGAIKEHYGTMMTITVLNGIAAFGNLSRTNMLGLVFAVVSALLTGSYAYMIQERKKINLNKDITKEVNNSDYKYSDKAYLVLNGELA